MKKIKYLLTAVLTFLLAFATIPSFALAEENSDGKIIVYSQVPDDWSNPYIWAWDDDGTGAFDAWPGEAMEADDANEGWYYCWIPESATNIIISANNAEVQTTDQKIEANNAWLTITDPETVSISYEQQTSGEIPKYVETFKVHAQVPDSWKDVCLWAWLDPDGTNASSEWPGKAMMQGEDGWYTATAPEWVNSIIINGNAGENKTEDLSIDPAEIWVTVSDDNSAEISYDDPNLAEVEDIMVNVQVPDDWEAPHLWAWSAPDGTNAFTSWPGEALEDNGDGWLSLSVPGWINSVIVNGNDGEIQTADLSVDSGKDLWITVKDADNAEVSYEEPEIDKNTTAEADADDTESQKQSSNNTGIIVAIVILIIVVIAVAAFVYCRKKKK